MESYSDHVKQSQKSFASMGKATKQLLQHFEVIVNRLVDLSDLLASIAKRESSFMRDPLEAMSSVTKTLAAEWSVAIKGIAALPNCFDMKEDNAHIQASIKHQAQAQPPFCIQTNHELVVNAAVFERTRAANIQQAIYNLGHSLLYMGIRAVESGTNLKTLCSVIDPHASVLDVAMRFRELDLGANVTMNMLLKLSADEVRNHLVPQLSERGIKYAGQLNSYKDKRRSRKHPSASIQTLSHPLPPSLSLTADKSESSQEAPPETLMGYQNVTINSPAGDAALPPQHPRIPPQPVEYLTTEKEQQRRSQQEEEHERTRQMKEYQQQIIEQQNMITSLQAQLREQLQLQVQQLQTPQPLQSLQLQQPAFPHQTVYQGALQAPASVVENKNDAPLNAALPPHQQYYSEDGVSTSDDNQGMQLVINAQQANNPFTKPKAQPPRLLANDLSNYINESELTDAHMRESTEVSQISMSKRASNALNLMTRSTTELDNMGDEYDLSRPEETIAPEKTANDQQQATKEDIPASAAMDLIDHEEPNSSKAKEPAKSKKFAINNFLRDPSAKNKERSSSKATAGLYSSLKDEDSFGLVNPAPTQPAKPKIDINALDDDDLDFF